MVGLKLVLQKVVPAGGRDRVRDISTFALPV
jgi:hypothetical protein